jgi:anti-sigma B factor antagonist
MSATAVIHVKSPRLDARALLGLLGEVDAALAQKPATLVLDLSAVTYIDSLGISAIVDIKNRCRPRVVVLAGLTGFVATVARATHLAEIFEIFPTLQAARESLTRLATA